MPTVTATIFSSSSRNWALSLQGQHTGAQVLVLRVTSRLLVCLMYSALIYPKQEAREEMIFKSKAIIFFKETLSGNEEELRNDAKWLQNYFKWLPTSERRKGRAQSSHQASCSPSSSQTLPQKGILTVPRQPGSLWGIWILLQGQGNILPMGGVTL